MKAPYQIVDLFAGPGGLAEGFSSVVSGGDRKFNIALSIEMEPAAHQTLTLRSFTRQFAWRRLPKAYYRFIAGEIALKELLQKFPEEWGAATREALCLELGSKDSAKIVVPKIDAIRKRSYGKTVLIGGPPCQAYSLVGRARNAGIDGYVPEDDGRHFLYREYIHILDRLRPAAFVMENVKGILSSSVGGNQIFQRILDDLANVGREDGGYKLLALTPNDESENYSTRSFLPRDFIVRAEKHGVPQARHRVFVVGVRADIATNMDVPDDGQFLSRLAGVSVRQSIGGLPTLRSGLSRQDDEISWRKTVSDAASELSKLGAKRNASETVKSAAKTVRSLLPSIKCPNIPLPRGSQKYETRELAKGLKGDLRKFIVDSKLVELSHHEARGHMKSDLARYLFCAAFAEANLRPPRASDFPDELAPNHQSWSTGKFADRFRVQTWDGPSTTITSHIAKDGHYYIHPDPVQCRSLTVREAARLQTFPDNYVFLGNRTQQYVQVGNAVPPFLAKQIAQVLTEILP